MSKSRAGVLLRQAREARHFNQHEVAKLMGTIQSAISRVENGASIPSFDRVVEVMNVMGLSVNLQIELIEVDEAAWPRNLELDPATRFKNAVRVAQFALAAVKGWHDVIFEPLQILAVLRRHRVNFVIVGDSLRSCTVQTWRHSTSTSLRSDDVTISSDSRRPYKSSGPRFV